MWSNCSAVFQAEANRGWNTPPMGDKSCYMPNNANNSWILQYCSQNLSDPYPYYPGNESSKDSGCLLKADVNVTKLWTVKDAKACIYQHLFDLATNPVYLNETGLNSSNIHSGNITGADMNQDMVGCWQKSGAGQHGVSKTLLLTFVIIAAGAAVGIS